MASIGGDTNTLLRRFMKRKRKPTPADRTAGLPKPGQGSKTTYSRSKAPPPGSTYLPAFVPGYGQGLKERAARKIGQYNAQNDRSRPYVTPTGRSQREPYRPARKKRPTLN